MNCRVRQRNNAEVKNLRQRILSNKIPAASEISSWSSAWSSYLATTVRSAPAVASEDEVDHILSNSDETGPGERTRGKGIIV
ncbi:hypothetical protein EMCRGX_G016651 [Ephydatia muelleri]